MTDRKSRMKIKRLKREKDLLCEVSMRTLSDMERHLVRMQKFLKMQKDACKKEGEEHPPPLKILRGMDKMNAVLNKMRDTVRCGKLGTVESIRVFEPNEMKLLRHSAHNPDPDVRGDTAVRLKHYKGKDFIGVIQILESMYFDGSVRKPITIDGKPQKVRVIKEDDQDTKEDIIDSLITLAQKFEGDTGSTKEFDYAISVIKDILTSEPDQKVRMHVLTETGKQ